MTIVQAAQANDTVPPKALAGDGAGSAVMHRTLKHQPIFVERAKGNYLYTAAGEKILDACGGAAVINVGHSRDDVADALYDQLHQMSYVHSIFWANHPAEELATRLIGLSAMERVVFYSSGSEAMEASIKLARQYHLENGQPQRVNYIAREQSYHGNTLGGMSLGRHALRRKPYLGILGTNFHSVSPCYAYRNQRQGETDQQYSQRLVDELEAKILELGPDTVAAFAAETVVGATAGTLPAVPGYFEAIRTVCDKYGVLLILDEIMCGMGRTGKACAWQHYDVKPDIAAIGKALSGGYVPLSAILVNKRIVDVLEKGSGTFNNGHTYQSLSLGCRAALEVQKIVERDDLLGMCQQRGKRLEAGLRAALADHPNVGDIRGQGLFWSLEFVADRATKRPFPASVPVAAAVGDECMKRGVCLYPGKGTIDGVNGDHILIAPPFVITEEEVDAVVDALKEAVQHVMLSIT